MKVSIGLWVMSVIGLAYAMFKPQTDKRIAYKQHHSKEIESIMKDFE